MTSKTLIEAAREAEQAIGDWVCTYADDMVGEEALSAAWARIREAGGVLAYTAGVSEALRLAIAEEEGSSPTPSPSERTATEELKPCPFCGGTRLENCTDDGRDWVRCMGCDATGPLGSKYDEDDDEDWNRRSPAPGEGGEEDLASRADSATRLASQFGDTEAQHSAGWRDIASAPRDGTEVLLYAPAREYQGQPCEARVTMGHWATDEECARYVGDCGGECRCAEFEYDDPYWLSWDGGFLTELPPTHWMPPPPPPAETGLSGPKGSIAYTSEGKETRDNSISSHPLLKSEEG